jgi:tetratricopeptide (TPR) repeat protein
LDADAGNAKELFQQALKLDPRLSNHIVRLAAAVTYKAQFPHSPVDFQHRSDEGDKLILLADVYASSREVYRINRLWENILKQRKRDLSKSQRSYIEMRRSLSVFNLTSPLEKDPKQVIEGYLDAQKLDPDAPWADRALYLAGNAAVTLNHDDEQAIALYQKLLDQYPERYLAAGAAFNIAVRYERLKKWKEAKDAFELVLEKYPESGREKLVNEHLRKLPRN